MNQPRFTRSCCFTLWSIAQIYVWCDRARDRPLGTQRMSRRSSAGREAVDQIDRIRRCFRSSKRRHVDLRGLLLRKTCCICMHIKLGIHSAWTSWNKDRASGYFSRRSWFYSIIVGVRSAVVRWYDRHLPEDLPPWPKKRTIVMMHHVISKNLRSNSLRCIDAWSRAHLQFRSWIKHRDSSILQDSNFMHQQHGSFFFLRQYYQ